MRVLGSVVVLVLVLLCLGLSGLLPARIVRVGSDSMTPTLTAQDLVLLLPGEPARRDVVVVRVRGREDLVIKRVVAVGGDEVAIADGVLTVDGVEVCEPGIDPDRIDGVWFPPSTVPERELFLLGDDRRDAVDSRDFGTVAVSDVIGLVPVRVWPSPGRVSAQLC